MNYFAHGIHFLDDPYFLAGTAVPDWLNVVDRRLRVRSRRAAGFVEVPDEACAALARGIVQHHRDDAWFHETPAFHQLSWQLTVEARGVLPCDDGFRPSFLGHILVEILLDGQLAARAPQRLEAYYRALESVDGEQIAAAVEAMAGRPAPRLAEFVERFCAERFLWDYGDDGKLWYRLNQVMRRVGLPPLPEAFQEVLPSARRLVGEQLDGLLAGWPSALAGIGLRGEAAGPSPGIEPKLG